MSVIIVMIIGDIRIVRAMLVLYTGTRTHAIITRILVLSHQHLSGLMIDMKVGMQSGLFTIIEIGDSILLFLPYIQPIRSSLSVH